MELRRRAGRLLRGDGFVTDRPVGASVLEKPGLNRRPGFFSAGIKTMAPDDGQFDASTIESCRAALESALATLQHSTPQETETGARVKLKLARFVIKHAADGITDPERLRKRALESYFRPEA